jgi:hypothetical protein
VAFVIFIISLILFCRIFRCFSIVCIMLIIFLVDILVYMLDISKEHIHVSLFMFKLRKPVVRCSVFVCKGKVVVCF